MCRSVRKAGYIEAAPSGAASPSASCLHIDAIWPATPPRRPVEPRGDRCTPANPPPRRRGSDLEGDRSCHPQRSGVPGVDRGLEACARSRDRAHQGLHGLRARGGPGECFLRGETGCYTSRRAVSARSSRPSASVGCLGSGTSRQINSCGKLSWQCPNTRTAVRTQRPLVTHCAGRRMSSGQICAGPSTSIRSRMR